MQLRYLLLFLFIHASWVLAQNNNVGINTSTPDPTAILHLESTTQGILVPRLTTVQRDAIAAPATGLIIYNTTFNQEEIFNGTCWIPSYAKNCTDCQLNFTLQQANYTVNRANNLTITIPVTIQQTTATNQAAPVTLTPVHTFSEETKVELDVYEFPGGTQNVNITINTNVFEKGGDHFVTLFGFCGDNTVAKSIKVSLSHCDSVIYTTNQLNADFSTGLTGNNCVYVEVKENVSIRSTNAANPSLTSGNLPQALNVGILVKGYVFGRGGNGPAQMTQNGQTGGTAINVNCNAEIRNKGMIYGGGGAGLTVGAFQSINITIATLCVAVGAGGGGGMPDGQGGGSTQTNCSVMVGFWQNGNNAESDYDDDEGAAISRNFTQNFSLGPVNGAISITANGGAGGDFGEPGTAPSQPISFAGTYLELCVNIPFIGNVCAPVPGFSGLLNTMANAIVNGITNATPGQGGFAIKYNNGNINIPNGNYQTIQYRGRIGS